MTLSNPQGHLYSQPKLLKVNNLPPIKFRRKFKLIIPHLQVLHSPPFDNNSIWLVILITSDSFFLMLGACLSLIAFKDISILKLAHKVSQLSNQHYKFCFTLK